MRKLIAGSLSVAVAAPIFGVVGLLVMIRSLAGWVDLHASHGGDRAAQDKARWRPY